MAAGGRRRNLRLRRGGKVAGAGAGGANLMKPHGGIDDLVKFGGCSGKFAACGIRTHAGTSGIDGHIVKPSATKSLVKPCSADSIEQEWIWVRGCRIKKTGLRFSSQGDAYVSDSEDEDAAHEVAANGAVGMEPSPAVASDGVAGVDMAPTVTAAGAASVDGPPAMVAAGSASVDVAPAVTADRVGSIKINPEVAQRLAKKVLGEDLHPDVAARLAEVLSDMEPLYHKLFIAMYKVMVPLFFAPPPQFIFCWFKV